MRRKFSYPRRKFPNDVSKDEDFIDISLASNILCADLMQSKFESMRKETQFSPESIPYDPYFVGNPDLQKSILDFFSKHTFRCPRDALTTDHVIVANGSMIVLETLAYYLYKTHKGKSESEEDISVAISSPFYIGFPYFIAGRFPLKILPVPKILKNLQYKIDLDGLKKAVEKPEVVAVVMCNPNNPCGTVYSKEEVEAVIDMCVEAKKHLIADEVFSLCRLSDGGKPYEFTSVYNIVANEEDPKKKAEMEKYVHAVYSLSKDFGLAGWRVGFLYSANPDVHWAFQMESFHAICPDGDIQFYLNKMFKDEEFITGWISEMQKRIDARVRKTWDFFDKQTGVEYVKCKAALFVWFHLPSIDTWKKEDDFYNHLLNDKKVAVEQGKYYSTGQPGWFRVSLSATDWDTLEEGLKRIFEALKEFAPSSEKSKIEVEIKVNGKSLLKYDQDSLSECKKVLQLMMKRKD